MQSPATSITWSQLTAVNPDKAWSVLRRLDRADLLLLLARALRSVPATKLESTARPTRLGSWLLHGELGRPPKLCALDIDPACAVDLFRERSIAARATWLGTLAAETARVPAELGTAERTPVELDPETRAALTVWGDVPE